MLALPVITIASGRHLGAALSPRRASISLGADPDCDLVLCDHGLAPCHARLRASPGGGVVVRAEDGPVEAVGLGRIEPGFEAELARGCEIEAGGARLRLGEPPVPPKSMRIGGPIAATLLAATLAAIPGALSGGGPAAPPRAAQVRGPVAAPAPRPARRDAMEALRARLAGEDLAGLDLTTSNGAIALGGHVAEDEAERLDAVLAWFDRSHPSAVLLTDGLTVGGPPAPPPEPPAIESVWHVGTEPWLVVDGAPLRAGETTLDGWALEAIEPGHAVFFHDGRRWRVHYAADAP